MFPDELKTVKESLEKGQAVNPVTVREFLAWFDVQRRGVANVERIRTALLTAGLYTIPDFDETWIDAQISFAKVQVVSAKGHSQGTSKVVGVGKAITDSSSEAPLNWTHREAGYRLSRLEAAHKTVISAAPNEEISAVVTKMMMHEFSQIPVLNGRDIKGVVTWPIIGSRAIFGKMDGTAADFMQAASVIDENRSIFEAISAVVRNDYVLVISKDRSITGIITAADLSIQFRMLAEPFLLLSDIETHLRNIIGRHFQLKDLKEAQAPGSAKAITTVSDLSFGDYVSLLQNPENWIKTQSRLDRKVFCEQLKSINKIRNQVMHFDPDGLEEIHLDALREFSNFLNAIEFLA